MEYLLYWLFFEFLGCSVARLVIPMLSLGRAHVHPLGWPPGRFNWLGYRRDERGRTVIARDVAGFIGFMIILIVFLVIVFMVRPF